jgi:hypothetical protein
MSSEALGKEKVLGGAVDVRHRRMAQSVEVVGALESGGTLPFDEDELDPPKGDPPPHAREE